MTEFKHHFKKAGEYSDRNFVIVKTNKMRKIIQLLDLYTVFINFLINVTIPPPPHSPLHPPFQFQFICEE